MQIVIIGNGKFGQALGKIFAHSHLDCRVLGKKDPWPQCLGTKKTIAVIAVPTQNINDVWENRREALLSCTALVTTTKGLLVSPTPSSGLTTPSLFWKKKLGKTFPLFVLTGPNFSTELSKGLPGASLLAGDDANATHRIATLLSNPILRFYKGSDPQGAELCGALKNVYAIAAGISDGLHLGNNARAALITRSLAEMSRVIETLGFDRQTTFGLAGVGDLFLTCSSPLSRNYRFGFALARKKKISHTLRSLGTVEGYYTCRVAEHVCRKHHIRAPLIETVNKILYDKLSPVTALRLLLSRRLRHEF